MVLMLRLPWAQQSGQSDGVIKVDKIDANVKARLDRFTQCFYAVAFRRMVAGRNEGCTRFMGHVEVLLGRFPRDVCVDVLIDGRLHHPLCTTSTPGNPLDRLLHITHR